MNFLPTSCIRRLVFPQRSWVILGADSVPVTVLYLHNKRWINSGSENLMKQERTRSHTTDALAQSFPLSGLKWAVCTVHQKSAHTHAHISPAYFSQLYIAAPDSWAVSARSTLEAQPHLVLITVNNNRSVCITGCQVSWDGCRTHWSLTHFPVPWTSLMQPARCFAWLEVC